MTGSETVKRALPLAWDGDAAAAAGSLLTRLRPADGWIALTLLTANLCVVVLSVERADWAPSPSLVGLLLLAMLTAFVFRRLPRQPFWLWGWLALLPGLALGALTVGWQVSGYPFDGEPLGSLGALWERLSLWLAAAREGSISIDKVPFSFALCTAAWLTGFLGAWLFLRHRNFWGVFALGGLGLLSNLTFLPPNVNLHLALYLFTALLLVARVQAVRRQDEWQRRGIRYDEGLRTLTLSDSFFLSLAVLALAFLLPAGGNWSPVTGAYESMRQPLTGFEDDFNRLFAGLPARRPIGFRVWDDVMAFQGTINPATTQVLQVDSNAPLYWKARSYSTYTSKGWISARTQFVPAADLPAPPPAQTATETGAPRVQTAYTVTPLYSSKVLFAGGSFVGVDRGNAEAEIPVFDDFPATANGQDLVITLPNASAEDTRRIREFVQAEDSNVNTASLSELLPPGASLAAADAETAPPTAPDVLSVRALDDGVFYAYEPYQITASVSLAEPEQLRAAGDSYPLPLLIRNTQLPPELPQRVKDLAASLTQGQETSYDKALAVESHLRTLPYNLQIEPPPFDADGVDHFLFEQGQGYSEYFASSMAVLLRSAGVPARVAVGYTTGDAADTPGRYAVTDSHSHAWTEVYFPRYGWIPFEPTPGAELPAVMVPGGGLGAEFDGPLITGFDFDCIDEFDLECGVPLEPLPGEGGLPGTQAAGNGMAPWGWALVAIGAAAALSLAGWWGHRRYLSASAEPAAVYGRLRRLAALGGVNPAAPRTPYQFGQRLDSLLPAYREPMSLIVDAYVRARYGGKAPSQSDGERLAAAWLNLRYPLLRAALLRRVHLI